MVPTASEVIWVLGHSLAEWEMVREPAQAGELQGLYRVLMGHNEGCLIGSWVCSVCPRDVLPFLAAWQPGGFRLPCFPHVTFYIWRCSEGVLEGPPPPHPQPPFGGRSPGLTLSPLLTPGLPCRSFTRPAKWRADTTTSPAVWRSSGPHTTRAASAQIRAASTSGTPCRT